MNTVLERLLKPLIDRWPWLATALAVKTRTDEIRGGYLASALTLNLFLSVFPLLLVAIAILGFITDSNSDLPQKIVGNLGLSGDSATAVVNALNHASETKRAASLIGLAGLAWSGLGVAAAIEYVLDTTWQQTGRGLKNKPKSVLWMIGAGLILGTSIAITTWIQVFLHGFGLSLGSVLIALVINFAFWVWTFLILTFDRVEWRAYVPGAIFGAIGLEVIKQLATWLPQMFNGSSALYGSIGVAFGIIAVLALFGRLVVFASTLNVVLWETKHGTVTVEVDVPRVSGHVPLEGTRSGATEF